MTLSPPIRTSPRDRSLGLFFARYALLFKQEWFCGEKKATRRWPFQTQRYQRITDKVVRSPPLYVFNVRAPFLMSPFSSKVMVPVTPLCVIAFKAGK